MTGTAVLEPSNSRVFFADMRAWVFTHGDPTDEARMRQLWADPPANWRSDLLDRNRIMTVLAYIQRHPEQWSQFRYLTPGITGLTGIRGCIASLTVALELEVGLGNLAQAMTTRKQSVLDIPHLAKQLLGLSLAQATCLFNYTGVPQVVFGLSLSREPTFDELVDRVALLTGVDFHARKPPLPAHEALSVIALPQVPVVPDLVGAAA